ncbi:transposase [Candidatus Mesenet endosymbiont of Phosphuga atrata]
MLYLPPYSPDLNPIEHCSHTIKSYLKCINISSSCWSSYYLGLSFSLEKI